MRVTRRGFAELGVGLGTAGLGLAPFALPPRAQAQPAARPAPPAEGEPFLRIETGAHLARTSDCAVDAAGRLLLTASDDKTARLWSLPELRPLGVLRPPLGPDRDGSIFAVAMTADGRHAAIGGWFGSHGRGGVLLFDLVSQQVVRRFAEVTSTVTRLAISPDGTRLAAGCGGTSGVVLWRLADGALLHRDTDYAAGVTGLAFAPDGRLLAAASDGALRLYDAAGQRRQKLATTAGHNPAGLAFSPNGRRLAVSYWDALALEIRDGDSLAMLGQPDLVGSGFTGTTAIGWSAEGGTLYASGRSDATNAPPLRPVYAWAAEGSGPRRQVAPGYNNGGGGLQPLAGGRLVFHSLSGDIAVLDGQGGLLAERLGGAGSMRREAGNNPTQRLPLSPDGQSIAWVFTPTQQRWQRFDAARAELMLGEPPADTMTNARTEEGGLVMTDWAASLAPKLNGTALQLFPNERAQSVAVGGGRALLGSGWNLRLYGADAKQLWHQPLQAQALRVNLSTDGRLAVCAAGDGTIRWHRLTDGAELLALFVTPDASRWVAWTPGSHYAASPGGEDLIGWHVNRGADKAGDFFPGSRFRDRFYRPDVVKLVLATLDEAAALAQANAARRQPARDLGRGPTLPVALTADLPAIITILDPAEDTEVAGGLATIAISLRSPSGGAITQVVPLLDGSPAVGVSPLTTLPTPAEAAAHGEQYYRFTLPLPPGRASLLAVRADTATREGVVATRRLRAAAAPAASTGTATGPAAPALAPSGAPKPRLNALLVGVSDYANPDYRTGVGFAAKDATDLAEVLRGQAQRSLFRDQVKVQTLTNAQASRGALLDALRALRGATRPDDVTVVSFAGHGVLDDGATHFMPQDGDVERLASTAVDPGQLGGLIAGLHGRVLVLFDICHAGNALFAAQRLPDVSGLVNQMRKPGAGVMVLAATPAAETAIEVPGGQNGAFTDAVLRALRGGATADAEGLIYTDQLIAYSKQWMRSTYRRNPISYPLDPNLPDFPLLSVR